MSTFVYSDVAWGDYYSAGRINRVSDDSLDKASTLFLYLYGVLDRPKDTITVTVTETTICDYGDSNRNYYNRVISTANAKVNNFGYCHRNWRHN